MKTIFRIIRFFLIFFCGLFLYSCQKEMVWQAEAGIAKVNVINAVVTGGNAKVNVSAKQINWSSIPDNQALGGFTLSRMFIVPTDRNTVFQLVPLSDTTNMWYNQVAQLDGGKVYTLYLSGTPTDLKTKFQEEINFPDYVIRDPGKPTPSADSIVNIRFVNLSSSGPKLDINMLNNIALEANDLGYQQFTDFKAYPARNNTYTITFQIRNSADKSLIATYDFNADFFRFKSVAVVLMGVYNTLGLPFVDNYRIESIPYQ
ncbi:DUF4397 domain-containing protein [Sphingobacterium kitahiroshimense]|uniref:DUF4397 domain-containing protein n=1 Tax=Sphingobacterium sp. B16(2022) TaxID=2914044 RepID=UPI00143876C1|nr:DUF4397 domain-containing protein [Sphingobacterium sp. B16(2022)]NJI74036.1 DUF4397 domain-containing protein [Sphingobacterium sp. B16(2022)]